MYTLLQMAGYAAWFIVITFFMFAIFKGFYYLVTLLIPKLPHKVSIDVSLYSLAVLLMTWSLINGTATITVPYLGH